MSSDTKHPDFCRRKALKVAVAAMCTESGFSHAEDIAIETLTEMLHGYLTEAGRSTQAYCEVAGRTEPMVSDVALALMEMGTDITAIEPYSKRPKKTMFMPPLPSNPPGQPKTLQAGEKRSLPPHIPDYLPQFPDPHTYIHTATHKPPPTEYQLIREKAASQKRDVECALTKFIAKTGETESLFSDDPYAFPLIANKPHTLPYLDALLLKEEDLDAQEQEDGEKPKPKKPPEEPKPKEEPEKPVETPVPTEETPKDPSQAPQQQQQQTPQQPQAPGTPGKAGEAAGAPPPEATEAAPAEGQIDNPYLREIKMPKLKATGRKNYTLPKW